jgi:outer membrane protein
MLLLLASPAAAWAQSTAFQNDQDESAASRWRLGLGVVASDNAYAGRSTQLTPFPLVEYEGERVFFRGITGGVHLFRASGLEVDAIASLGLNAIDADDFGRARLARRGIDRHDLQDRKRSIDAGLAATWSGSAGRFRLEAKSDVSGHSKGQQYVFNYAYPLHLGGFAVAPGVGATFLSAKVADYYYGIHAKEVRRGVPGYRPGSALIPEAGVTVSHALGAKWDVQFRARYSVLPDKISDSPLVDGGHGASVFVGFSRAF